MSVFNYAPGVTNQSGQFLAAGISGAANAISGTLDRFTKMYEDNKQLTSQAKALETLLPQYGKAAGIGQEQIDAMLTPSPDESPRDRVARLSQAMEGIVTTSTLKAKAQQADQLQTLIAGEKQRQAEIERQRTETDAQRGRMRTMFGGTPSSDEISAMIGTGPGGAAGFQELSPASAPPATSADAVRGALAAGIEQPRLIDAIGRYAGPKDAWSPTLQDLGNGVTAMMTSPRSAIPVVKPTTPKTAAPYKEGPLFSPDMQFYQTGPDQAWKPVKAPPAGAKLDPMLVGTITQQIQQLEAEKLEHQKAIVSGDNRFGFANINSRKDAVQEIDAKLAGLRATLNAGRTGGTGAAVTPGASRFKVIELK